MLLDPVITVSERARLLGGSQESVRLVLEALVTRTGSERTGVDAPHVLAATFGDHVIVEAAQQFYKIPVFRDSLGYVLGKSEPLFVQRVSRKQVVEETLYGVVDALLTGSVDEAVVSAMQLMPCLGEAKELLAYADTAKRVESLLDRDCPWKAVVVENAVKAGAVVPDGAARFGKLYDGSLNPSEIAGFDELVRTEFGEQVAELDTLWHTVSSLESILKLLPDDKAAAYTNLVEDYKRDLHEVRDVLKTVQHQVQDAAVLGRVSDGVAGVLPKHRALCSHLQLQLSH